MRSTFSPDLIERATDMYYEELMTQQQIADELAGPSQPTISRWIRDDPRHAIACKRGDAAIRGDGKKTSSVMYPYKTRREAVKLAEETDLTRSQIAEKLGIRNRQTVTKWVTLARKEGYGALMTVEDKRKIRGEGADSLPNEIEELKRQNAELRLEKAILEQTVIALKKDRCVDPEGLTNREKATIVDALRGEFGLEAMLGKLGLARSSYYYQLNAMAAGDKYEELGERIASIFHATSGTRGYRYITNELRCGDDPVVVSEKVVRRIMSERELNVIYVKKKRGYSSYKGEITDAPENLVERDFHADAPNELWLTDITQFTLPGFKCYLSPVIDCFDGKVVARRISLHPNALLANTMLEDAVATLEDGEHPTCHSDRGCHYRWPGWIKICDEAGITRSMSKKGCSPDNAACEAFFGRLKNEFFYYRDWNGVTFEEFSGLLEGYIDYYNEDRKKQSLNWMSPNQYRRSLGIAA